MSVEILKGELLATIPSALREELFIAYTQIINNFRERRWEPSELNGGKLCEIVYNILRGYVDNSYPSKSSKPDNMVRACQALEQLPASNYSRSVRIQIPRMLIALYEIRNNRGVGHSGGDVNPNHMDATCVLEMSKWILSELIRLFHNVTTEDASLAVDNLVERTLPVIWEVKGKRRVLDIELSMKDKTLLLLYHSSGAVEESLLFAWVEHSNSAVYRRDVLRALHNAKMVEYDPSEKMVHISPKGIHYVESELL